MLVQRVRIQEHKIIKMIQRAKKSLVIEKQWPKKDGAIMKISDMSEGHLLNCAYKIVKESWRLDFLDNIIEEMNNRGLHQEAQSVLNLKKMNDSLE